MYVKIYLCKIENILSHLFEPFNKHLVYQKALLYSIHTYFRLSPKENDEVRGWEVLHAVHYNSTLGTKNH